MTTEAEPLKGDRTRYVVTFPDWKTEEVVAHSIGISNGALSFFRLRDRYHLELFLAYSVGAWSKVEVKQ